ncbi:MAG: AIPR family protein [Ignavibacteriaceae bacterium]
MRDIVIDGNLKTFVEDLGFQDLKESEQFERFCSFSILNKEFNYSLSGEDLNDISVGKNKGIDSIAFYVGGELIKNNTQFEEIKKTTKQKLDIKLYFLQSKTSDSFEDSQIGNFLDTTIDFLTKKPNYPMTPEAKEYHEIYLSIQNDFRIIKEFNIYGYFCCAGVWNNDTTCAITLNNKKKTIEDLELFDKVDIRPIDRSRIIELYKQTSNPINATFDFINRVQIRNLNNVEEAYIGYIPFTEFKKLIVDEDNGNLKNLFYDNIRDFLGLDNEVNEKIFQTLTEKEFSQFSLFNNGVTIIAEENSGRQEQFILNNYQIVNGCQTSNVLYECLDIDGINDTIIPIKIVITKDEELRDKIILSTNSQSKIDREGLLALTTFQKQLEEFYTSSNDKLYYERRNKQYANSPNVKQKNIVNIREQIKSFVAMFLEEPDAVSGYFGKIYKERLGDIFITEHLFEPYYVAGLIQFRFKELLNTKEIERKYNKARYHIFMLFRMLEESESFNKEILSSKKKKIYFEHLISKLRDKKIYLDSFKKIFEIIDKSGINILDSKQIYLKTTTKSFIESLKATVQENAK